MTPYACRAVRARVRGWTVTGAVGIHKLCWKKRIVVVVGVVDLVEK
jgi:hypothetical protein